MEEVKKVLELQKSKDKKFGVHINIFGAKGSGKTYKAKEIIKNCFSKPISYYMTNDFNDLDIAIFKPNNLYEDLEPFLKWCIKMGKEKKIDSIIFDEADIIFPKGKNLSPTMVELIDKQRHYNLSLIFISRRPQNLPTYIAEEGHFNIIFSIEGENVFKKLNAVKKGFGDLVASLEYKSYDYVFKELGKEPEIKNDK